MRKTILPALLLLLCLLSGCSKSATWDGELGFDKSGNYTGFQSLPEHYTVKQAVKDGFYVEDHLKTVGGKEKWECFVADSSKGRDTQIRIVSFFDDSFYFHDLFYKDGYYRIFDSSSENQKDEKFQYLLDLTGRLRNAARDGRYVILTDDNTITYSQVAWSMLSSKQPYPISKFRFVFIGLDS